jgi:acyl-CoA synthetase (AMP-forming)/AMP-acid ligase II
MLTSGTSGAAKRIPLSYRALGFSLVERQAKTMRGMGEAPPDDLPAGTLIQYGPIVHLGGLFTALQAGVEGRPLVLLEKFTVESWRRAVRLYRPRMLGLPPAQMRMVLDAGLTRDDLAGAISARSGNAMLDGETERRFIERFAIPVLNVYGATEYCGPIAGWSLADRAQYGNGKEGSVGRVWRHVARMRIVDPESGAELASGETGRLDVFVPSMSADWISTNDLASVDSDGFLYLHGRADDAINRGGFKISPTLVADALRRHESVADAAVFGIPDSRLGAVPVAAVEHRTGTPRPSEDELKIFLRRHLVSYQVPTQVLVLDKLPRTPGYKVSKPEVLALFRT